jgi:hypothetical protein
MHCARSNMTVPQWTDAFDAFQKSEAFVKGAHLRQTTSQRWRSSGEQTMVRFAADNSNKFMIAHSVRGVERRAAAITPEIVKASRERKADLEKKGISREAMVRDRKELKRGRQGEALEDVMTGLNTRPHVSKKVPMIGKTKRVVFDDIARGQLAACSRPEVPQTASAMLNLDGNGKAFGAPKTKETVAQELEARGIAVKRAKKNPQAPSENMGDMIEKLKEHEGGKTVVKRLVADYEAATTTPRWQ